MKPACEYAGKFGITLGIENHGGITARAPAVLEILHRVDSPYAGVNLDIANFEANSDEEMYSDIKACVPYATHAHIRDVFGTSKRPSIWIAHGSFSPTADTRDTCRRNTSQKKIQTPRCQN